MRLYFLQKKIALKQQSSFPSKIKKDLKYYITLTYMRIPAHVNFLFLQFIHTIETA